MKPGDETNEVVQAPDSLSSWRWIVVNSSGGKDSQTALRVVVDACDKQGVDRSRIVVSHQCLGRMEWKGTLALVEQQAAHYGLRVEVSKYRDKNGTESTLLDYVRARRKNYTLYRQDLPILMCLMVWYVTENLRAKSATPQPSPRLFSITLTCCKLNLAMGFLLPNDEVPCSDFLAVLAACVSHRRLSARQFAGLPSKCETSVPSSLPGTNSSATNRCREKVFLILPLRKLCIGYPLLLGELLRIKGSIDGLLYRPPEPLNDLTRPLLLTSYPGNCGTGSQCSEFMDYRYCSLLQESTSRFKRGPGGRVIVKLFREAAGSVLNVYGFRSDESPARAKKKPFVRNLRFSSGQREVWDWLPIHEWDEAEVWKSIRESGVPHHKAYDMGMSRLSCCMCIFAPRDALLVSGRANPELLDEYCELENEIGHTFQNGRSISSIRDAIRAGEQPKATHGAWNM